MTMSEQRRKAWQSLQGMAVPSAQDIQQQAAQSAANHYSGQNPFNINCQNPFNIAEAPMHVAGAPHKPAVYDSSDALLGELLREVLSMAKAMEGLRGEVADLRAEIRGRAQQIPLSQRTLPDGVVGFPQTALRHGTPR